jgi:undecaprenyl-phosphate galactose phosphotransferase
MLDQRKLYGEYIKNYIRVLPGMTGLWQVSGRSETTFARRASLDREYIQRWSLWLDIYIILKTVKILLFKKNAY